MTISSRRLAYFSVLLLLLAGCQEPVVTVAQKTTLQRIHLPKQLREISGLTTLGQNLLAIADERGRIFEINFEQQSVEDYESFGDPPVKEDFEGLALMANTVYAITSDAKLYQKTPGSDVYTRHKTGLKKQCEFEGLAPRPQTTELWLLCKTPLKKKLKKRLVIFVWDTQQQVIVEGKTISRAYSKLGFKKSIHLSGISFNQQGSEVTIIAAKQRAFVTMDVNSMHVGGKEKDKNEYTEKDTEKETHRSAICLLDKPISRRKVSRL